MNKILLDPEYAPDAAALARSLCLEPGSGEESDFFALLKKAARTARPKSACRAKDGTYYYIATCGKELDRAAEKFSPSETLHRFWFESIMRDALAAAETAAHELVSSRSGGQHFAMVGPGSLPEWGIGGQRELFAFLTAEAKHCGVRLDGNCVMRPLKSSSGMFLRVEENWSLCRVCGRTACRERR